MKSRTEKSKKPRIVCIGGGTGLPVILSSLRDLDAHITAIIAVTDDGGSSGIIRSEFNISPPGDVRNALVALSSSESRMARLCQYRFKKGTALVGHSLGNLILTALTDITDDFASAIKELARVLDVRHLVLPTSNQNITLKAQMTDGSIIHGESLITRSKKIIKQIYLDPPDAQALPETIEAISNADIIIAGPGSLYTSILPNLLFKEVSHTIMNSKAIKLFICNIMTQPGETDYFSASDHINNLHSQVGYHLFDTILINTSIPPESVMGQYTKLKQRIVCADIAKLQSLKYNIIADDLLSYNTKVLRHDMNKIREHITKLLKEQV